MQYIIWTKNNGQLLLTIAGEDIDTTLAVANIQAPYLVRDSEDLPDAPPSAWVVDWNTGVITVDPTKIPAEVIPSNWDGLNQAIMSNPEFNQAYATVMQSHPLVAAAIPAALTQVASGQTSMFKNTFLAMCQVAQVSPEQRAIWADIGATFHAPSDFLDIVRGTDG